MTGRLPVFARRVFASWASAFLVPILCVLPPGTSLAQRAANAQRNSAPAVESRVRNESVDDELADMESAPVVVANGTPRSFQVVRVPVPAIVPPERPVSYDIVSVSGATILGARHGGMSATGERAVVVTVGIPSIAIAGRTTIAYVRFTAEGIRPVRVPVELEVPRIPRVRITTAQNLYGVRPGQQLELRFAISNAGNLRDSLQLRVDAPPTWNPRFTAAPFVVLMPGETIDRSVRLVIPTASDIGDFPITLIANATTGERARGSVIVEVTDMTRVARRAGPAVTIGAASAVTEGGTPQSVQTASIDGPLADGVMVSGHFVTPFSSDPLVSRALSSLGYSSQANFVSLASRHFSAAAGATGLRLNELAGQTVFGRGASVELGADRAGVRVLAANPFTLNEQSKQSWSRPSLLAGALDVRAGSSVFTGFLARLRDSAYMVRSLDVAGIGVETTPWRNGLLSAQVAERRYDAGEGVGAAAELRGPIAGGDLSLRAIHAPGGTAAFAPTRDAYTASAGRRFGRLRADAGYWATRDRNGAATSISTNGWSVSPSYSILAPLTVGAEVRRLSYSSSGVGALGSSQQEFAGKAHLRLGGFNVSADSRFSSVSRDATSSAGSEFAELSRRLTHRGRLDFLGTYGSAGIGGSVESAATGSMSVESPTTTDVHIDRLQLLPHVPGLTVSGMVQRMQYGPVTLTSSRGEINVELLRSIRLAVGAERGIVRDAQGLVRTVLTFRVERTTMLPSLSRHIIEGVVFEDRNGSGTRDPGEPGVEGIIVHRGSETAVSDRRGVFRISADVLGRTEIDSRSLPEGWLQSPRLLDAALNELELGVVPTTALEVRVAPAPLADSSVPNVRVGQVTLVLRDAAGREWSAQADASSRATFDALPSGRYTLSVELEGSSEPLILDSIPPIDVGAVRGRQRITVLARTRPVRVFRPRSKQGQGSEGTKPDPTGDSRSLSGATPSPTNKRQDS